MRRLFVVVAFVAAALSAVALAIAALVVPAAPAAAAEPGWRVVSAGTTHTCGVRTDLTLWCWGSGEDGRLGTGNERAATRPVRVGGMGAWDTVKAGGAHTCGLRRDGSLWCWGLNSRFAVGIRGSGKRLVPTRVDAATDWKELTAGRWTTCAIKRDRTLWCWGTSLRGALGQGDTHEVGRPAQVGDGHSWTAVAAGRDHVCGTQHDRSLWCWGSGGSGQLGLGEELTDRSSPARVGAALRWTGVTAGDFHSCAIRTVGPRTDRTLWCWGRDRHGELGLGEPSPRVQHAPARVLGARSYLRVAAGGGQTCAARGDRSLWCWGMPAVAGTGRPASPALRSRVEVPGATGKFQKLATGQDHTCAIDAARRLWCWGLNPTGALGTGDTADRPAPTPVT